MTIRDFLAPVVRRNRAVMTRGEGSFVWDTAGRRYLDLNAGQFCSILGHSHPDVAEFVRRQASKLQNTSTTTIGEEALDAAFKLHELTADMDGRSVFLSTGAEANECCLRYAKHLTGRPGVISFDAAWHGLTLGTECLSVSRRHVKPQIPETYAVPVPPVRAGDDLSPSELDTYVAAFADVARLHGDRVAAAIFEPIVSSGEDVLPARGLLPARERDLPPVLHPARLRRVPDGVLDARVRGFTTSSSAASPTSSCAPRGWAWATRSLSVVFRGGLIPPEGLRMQLYSSHQNDPFGTSLVSFAIDWMVRNDLLPRIAEHGRYFLDRLTSLAREFPRHSQAAWPRVDARFRPDVEGLADYSALSDRFLAALLDRGCLLQAGNAGRTVRLLPSYLVERSEIDLFVDTVRDVLTEDGISK